jgi:DNA polymerase I-like protein with 3'-5' exonuclease and polymerase domains
MITDDQKSVYDEIMIPSMKLITHMELTGMPMDEQQIHEMNQTLISVIFEKKHILMMSQLIKDYEWVRQREACVVANLLLKRKVRPIEDFYERFNPASTKQVQELLYNEDMFNLPVLDKTDSGAPAVGAKTLKKHLNHLTNKYKLTEEELI